MKVEKKVIDHIEKCYAVTEIEYDGERHLLCSAEGKGPCRSYDLQGNVIETLWDEPGGVMTLVQVPDVSETILLATQGFYSPDNASHGKLVYYHRKDNQWHCETLCDMPFVHRFGIVSNGKKKYLIAATLKSANAFDGDWTCPGRVWTTELPENILQYNSEHQLSFEPFMSGLYKNHGFSINEDGESSYAVLGTENGVYAVYPPEEPGESWKYELLLEEPVSDVLYRDFDNDGEKELLVIAPFHGEDIRIFKKNSKNEFVKVYEREKKMPFAHAIWGDVINGREYAFVGGRREDMELISLYYDMEKGQYTEVSMDAGTGAANCMLFRADGENKLLTTNRETDEVAVYSLFPEQDLND